MKVQEVLDHFLSRADWVKRDTTVDRVIAGDSEADVDRCLVTWMPSFEAARQTAARGARLLVGHEPTFYNHRDDRVREDALAEEKRAFIEQHGLVVVRIHDSWDRWPKIGIPWAWADFLGLGPAPAQIDHTKYQHAYDITPVPLGEFARQVAARCAAIGEPFVQLTGDLDRTVSRIGIGTGCCCDIGVSRRMGCDCSIVCDDGSCYWAGIQWAADAGHAVIRVNHGTSEEPGMVTLTRYINENLGLRAELLPHGSTFRLVGGESH